MSTLDVYNVRQQARPTLDDHQPLQGSLAAPQWPSSGHAWGHCQHLASARAGLFAAGSQTAGHPASSDPAVPDPDTCNKQWDDHFIVHIYLADFSLV